MSTSSTVNLNWGFWDAQLEALEALESGKYDLVTFRTGYGGGKTVLGARWIHKVSLENPEAHCLVLAPSFQEGGPATYKGFFEELPGENTVPNDAEGDPENSPIVAGYNHNEKRLTYVNGSVARLGSADTWNRYAGSEFNAIWCDEVSHYGTTSLYDLHEMLVSRQRTDQGPNVTLWTSTGNGYDEYYDITEREVDENEEPLSWADRMEVITGSSLDNPFLNEKEKMAAQFEGTEREDQALHGGFSAATGLVYSSFSRQTHVVERNEVEVRDEWRIYGYDYGFKDPRVLLEIGKTPVDQYVVLDSYYEEQKPVEDLVGEFNGRKLVREGWVQQEDKQPGPVFCDHDPEHIQKFARADFKPQAANKDIDEGIEEVRGYLETDEEGRPGLLIVEDCTNLIQEFMSYKEDDVGTSRAIDHALDSLRYAIMGDSYIPSGNTASDDGGISFL